MYSKSVPLSPKLLPQAWDDDSFGSCPIVEDKPIPNKDEEASLEDRPYSAHFSTKFVSFFPSLVSSARI